MNFPCKREDLDLQPAADGQAGGEEGYIVHQPNLDRIHFLNAAAVLVLELCDGTRSPGAIAALVNEAYGDGGAMAAAVPGVLAQLREAGLIQSDSF